MQYVRHISFIILILTILACGGAGATDDASENPPLPNTFAGSFGFRLRNAEGSESRPISALMPSINGIESFGVSHALVNLNWHSNTSISDARIENVGREINALRGRGIRPFVVIGTWNPTAPGEPYYPYWPTDATNRTSLVNFVLKFLRTYGEIDFTVSNEPNRQALNDEDLRHYCRNVIAVSEAMRDEGLPGRLFGFGGSTTDSGPALAGPSGTLQAISLTDFLAICVEMDLLDALDGVHVQAYGSPSNPSTGRPEELYLTYPGNTPKLGPILAWKGAKPFAVTELGAPSAPSPWMNEEFQSQQIQRNLFSAWAAGAQFGIIYEYMDSPWDPGDTESHYGVVDGSNIDKKAAADLRKLVNALGNYTFSSMTYQGSNRWKAIFTRGALTTEVRWSMTPADANTEYPVNPSDSLP